MSQRARPDEKESDSSVAATRRKHVNWLWFSILAGAAVGSYALVYWPSSSGIAWGDDLAAAKEAAKRRGTGVLIDFTTEGCVYCFKMDREVFSLPDIAADVARFEPVKLYYTRNQEVAAHYGVDVFPTFMVIRPDGEPVLGVKGYLPPDEFKRYLQQAFDTLSRGAGT